MLPARYMPSQSLRIISLIAAAALLLAACTTTPPTPEAPTLPANPSPPLPTAITAAEPTSQPVTQPTSPSTSNLPETVSEEENTCTGPLALTPAMTEGPYYTANTPERTNLYQEGIPGTRIRLTGRVLTPDCQPVAGVFIDFWQADGAGVYDNSGYTLRGHQFSDENGNYVLETVLPGRYPGRTPHIHVKVQAPGGPMLTSQLFFPGEAQNETDRIFDPLLLVRMDESGEVIQAVFDFVIQPGP